MTIQETSKFIESTVYHELGHVTGYALANKKIITKLGKIKYLEIGLKRNLITPSVTYYHIEHNITESTPRLQEATTNIKRTIAWFIEVLFGCTLQTIFEKTEFKLCFGQHKNFNGSLDYNNISNLRLVSQFKWNIQEIYDLQKDLEEIIYNEKYIHSIKPIVKNILNQIEIAESHQVIFSPEQILLLETEIDNLISSNFVKNYELLIEKHTQVFTRKEDLKVEINFRRLTSKVYEFKSGENFQFNFEGVTDNVDGKIRLIHKDVANPGDSLIANILFNDPNKLLGKLKSQMKFNFSQYSGMIGNGSIMKISNKDLELAYP